MVNCLNAAAAAASITSKYNTWIYFLNKSNLYFLFGLAL